MIGSLVVCGDGGGGLVDDGFIVSWTRRLRGSVVGMVGGRTFGGIGNGVCDNCRRPVRCGGEGLIRWLHRSLNDGR